jgi:hypothetical protein
MAQQHGGAVRLTELNAQINDLIQAVEVDGFDDMCMTKVERRFDVGLYLFLFFRRN